MHGQNEELVDELVSLSTKYGILTPYTSFLADERVPLHAMGANAARSCRSRPARGAASRRRAASFKQRYMDGACNVRTQASKTRVRIARAVAEAGSRAEAAGPTPAAESWARQGSGQSGAAGPSQGQAGLGG